LPQGFLFYNLYNLLLQRIALEWEKGFSMKCSGKKPCFNLPGQTLQISFVRLLWLGNLRAHSVLCICRQREFWDLALKDSSASRIAEGESSLRLDAAPVSKIWRALPLIVLATYAGLISDNGDGQITSEKQCRRKL
jgi:hypothetical protein